MRLLGRLRFVPANPERVKHVLRSVVLGLFFSLGLLTGLFSINASRFESMEINDLSIGFISEGWSTVFFLFSVCFSLFSLVLSFLVRHLLRES